MQSFRINDDCKERKEVYIISNNSYRHDDWWYIEQSIDDLRVQTLPWKMKKKISDVLLILERSSNFMKKLN